MNSPNSLEINGNLAAHPVAELLVEIMQSPIDGSLRLASRDHKVIIYIKSGQVVYAVSNQRQHRIFEMLLEAGLMTKQQLVEIPDFTNDLVLLEAIRQKELIALPEVDLLATRQIEMILKSALEWKDGAWNFSPLARIREDVCRKLDTYSVLIEKARNLPKESIVHRYKSFKEMFGKKSNPPAQINLRPPEAFLLSRFNQSLTRIEELHESSGLSEAETLQTLYILWLGGFLFRQNWSSALTPAQISQILSAKLELKKQVPQPAEVRKAAPEPPLSKTAGAEKIEAAKLAQAKKDELTLEKYLAQVERAETHYELLNITYQATVAEIKQAYFNLAKRFHPDLFHKQTDAATHERIEHAFTEIAHAYETLRNEETRQTYDFKLRKLLDELERNGLRADKPERQAPKSLTEAADIFEHGYSLLTDERYEEAMTYLVRAVHLAPNVARYRAFYGQLLSMDRNQRFKAEAEFQSAVKLEPQNPQFRLMLANFFIQNGLFKRAEGELNRLLAIAPNNREAAALLDSLPHK